MRGRRRITPGDAALGFEKLSCFVNLFAAGRSPLVTATRPVTVGGSLMRSTEALIAVLVAGALLLSGCDSEIVPHDVQSVLFARLHRSEIFGFLAGFGTTFAAMPDLLTMLRQRSSAGMNPRMAGIMAMFQVLWVYYGFLIGSRPVIAWNVVAVIVNTISVAAYFYFRQREALRAAA
jgi:uncharacterized protein with PQ loop repeat